MEHQNEKSTGKVWFITGASRGFGRVWTEAALQRGDRVAATARKLSSIADLNEKYGASVLTLELDVTNTEQVKTVVAQAHAHFGRLDIVLNNAGYSLVGTIEESTAADVKAIAILKLLCWIDRFFLKVVREDWNHGRESKEPIDLYSTDHQ